MDGPSYMQVSPTVFSRSNASLRSSFGSPFTSPRLTVRTGLETLMHTSGRRTELQLTGRESPSVPVPPQNLVATPMTSRSSSPIVQNLVVHPVAPHSRSSSPTVQSSVTPFQRLGNLSIAVHNLNHATKSTLASSP